VDEFSIRAGDWVGVVFVATLPHGSDEDVSVVDIIGWFGAVVCLSTERQVFGK
jgi:hypothetical protein